MDSIVDYRVAKYAKKDHRRLDSGLIVQSNAWTNWTPTLQNGDKDYLKKEGEYIIFIECPAKSILSQKTLFSCMHDFSTKVDVRFGSN